jgi:hypothetical protein
MKRPRREEFILDVRRAAKILHKPSVPLDPDDADADAITGILNAAALWLTPKVVKHYDPDDFATWRQDQQDRLRLAVDDFKKLAGQVAAEKPPTVEQFLEGARRLRDLVKIMGEMVLEEWIEAITSIETQAESWSAEVDWRTRRVPKKISESLLGTYEAPQLLIYAEPNLFVLDPVARFNPGGQGAFDLAIQPSYYTTSLYRGDDGNWSVHLEVQNGVSKGTRVDWSKDAFRQCIEQLKVFV